MKQLNKILNSQKSKVASEEEKWRDDTIKAQSRKQALLEQQNNQEKIGEAKAIFRYSFSGAFTYGVVGLLLGALLGFGKGCKSYGDHYVGSGEGFLEPFRYIPENAITICLYGAIIGFVIGLIRGKLE